MIKENVSLTPLCRFRPLLSICFLVYRLMWALMFTYLINNCLNSVSYIFLIVLTGIQGQLKEMQATQKEILSTMKVVRNEIRDLKREWEKEKKKHQRPSVFQIE